jgi:GNAT superfamily N-acetyltransferase
MSGRMEQIDSQRKEKRYGGIFLDDVCIGVGGINKDPFVEDKSTGRVRRVYISTKYRGLGLSRVLMDTILKHAKNHFDSLRLSTKNPIAASLYESLGFEKTIGERVTHILKELHK